MSVSVSSYADVTYVDLAFYFVLQIAFVSVVHGDMEWLLTTVVIT